MYGSKFLRRGFEIEKEHQGRMIFIIGKGITGKAFNTFKERFFADPAVSASLLCSFSVSVETRTAGILNFLPVSFCATIEDALQAGQEEGISSDRNM